MKDFNKKIYILIVLIILFVPALLIPVFKNINENDIYKFDKRYATTLIDVYNSAEKPITFESWFSDHLSFRKNMISIWATLNHKISVSCRPHYIVVGKNNWLFFGNQYENAIDKYRNIFDFEERDLDSYLSRLLSLDNYLTNKDIPFLFVVAPDKESMYSEHLPSWVTVSDSSNYTEALFKKSGDFINSHKVLNLAPIISSKKAEYGDDLYYKSDGHWSTLGAYFGYEGIMDNLIFNSGYELEKVKFFGYEKEDFDNYSLQKTLGMAGRYNDFKTNVNFSPQTQIEEKYLEEEKTWQNLQLYENKNALNNKSILIIRDSYSNAMKPYFYNTFEKTYVIHYEKAFLSDGDASNFYSILDEYEPHMVVLQVVERRLFMFSSRLPKEFK